MTDQDRELLARARKLADQRPGYEMTYAESDLVDELADRIEALLETIPVLHGDRCKCEVCKPIEALEAERDELRQQVQNMRHAIQFARGAFEPQLQVEWDAMKKLSEAL